MINEQIRTVEVLTEDGWIKRDFMKLAPGHIFRIFDAGKLYIDKNTGKSVWVATSEPFYNEDGIGSVQIEEYE